MSKAFKPVAGRKGELAWLNTEQMFVDHGYQRGLSEKGHSMIRKIADAWDWGRVGALVVSPRCTVAGLEAYAIVDGQHRFEAARRRGDIDQLPCYIVQADAPSQEAKTFVGLNRNRVNMTPIAIYYADLAAGDAKAERLAAVLADANVIIPTNGNAGDQPNQAVAVARMLRLLDQYPEDSLRHALIALVEAAEGECCYLKASMIEGLTRIYARHGRRLDPDRLIHAIGEKLPDEWAEASRHYRSFQRCSTGEAAGEAILKEYNHNLGKANRLSLQGELS
jgi:hypothetical protein